MFSCTTTDRRIVLQCFLHTIHRGHSDTYHTPLAPMADLTAHRSLQIVTWNVRGLGDPRKRRQLLAYLDRHQIHIALLQETHINPLHLTAFATKWADHRLFLSYFSYARGTAILIKKQTPFALAGTLLDHNGRYSIAWGQLGTDSITLVSCYGPNVDTPEFFTVLWGKFWILALPTLYVALNPAEDRSNPAPHHYNRSYHVLEGIKTETGLLDAWRHFHPLTWEGTHFATQSASWA